MKASRILILSAAPLLVALGGCSESPQTTVGVRSDTAPHQGPGSQFSASGWKPGDRVSWEQQLKVRTQHGQNDHAR